MDVASQLASRLVSVTESGCWLWSGATNPAGYGSMTVRGVRRKAHRIAYEIEHGVTLGSEQFICHKCDTPSCCNPAHLFLGDAKINAQDRADKGRQGFRSWTKLNESKVRELLALRASGTSLRKLAARFGICVTSVVRIVSGQRWKQVTKNGHQNDGHLETPFTIKETTS